MRRGWLIAVSLLISSEAAAVSLNGGTMARFARWSAARGAATIRFRDAGLQLSDPRCPRESAVGISAPPSNGTEVSLRCDRWAAIPGGFRYSDPGGEVRTVLYRPGSLLVRLRGTPRFATPVEHIDVRFRVGAESYCGRFSSFYRNDGGVAASAGPTAPCPQPFTEVAAAGGLADGGSSSSLEPARLVLGGGAAVGDYDGDGLTDVFLSRPQAPARLFHNDGGHFTDVTAANLAVDVRPGLGVWADIDNDGDLDLCTTGVGVQTLYLLINDGYGRFTEEAEFRGAVGWSADPAYAGSLALADADGDGWLDIFASDWRWNPDQSGQITWKPRLLHNLGARAPGFFTDVTATAIPSAVVVPSAAGGAAPANRFVDLDADGWPDLAVTGPGADCRLLWNQGDGTFGAGAPPTDTAQPCALADMDGDGLLDWLSLGSDGVEVFPNLGQRRFGAPVSLGGPKAAGAVAFLDFDGDGASDLVALEPLAGDAGAMVRLWGAGSGLLAPAWSSGLLGTGRPTAQPIRWLQPFDYDGDGHMDLLAMDGSGRPALYRNEASGGDAIEVAAIGRNSNRGSIGARVTVESAGLRRAMLIEAGDPPPLLSLGAAAGAGVTLSVEWPLTSRRSSITTSAGSREVVVEPPPDSGPVFTDVTRAAGVWYPQPGPPPPCTPPYGSLADLPEVCARLWTQWVSGGAAAGDYDGDGFPDLFVTRAWEAPILFHNRGDGTFEDQTAAAGLALGFTGNGAAWGDIDNDGDLDLMVTTVGERRNYLFINDGHGHFTEEARERGAAIDDGRLHMGTGVTLGDYDNDGWLDVYLGDFGMRGPGPFDSSGPSLSRLLHNRGAADPGVFDDVTDSAGVGMDYLFSQFKVFAPAFVDLDGDGWQDLTVVSDSTQSRLFWNQGNGHFVDGTNSSGVAASGAEMGSTFADWDGDGRLDWFVSAISLQAPYASVLSGTDPQSPAAANAGNNLYRNDGDRHFTEVAGQAGVRFGHWGWGAVFFDYDNDGDQDLAMVNGVAVGDGGSDDAYHHDPMRFWRNEGNGAMTEMAAAVGLNDLAQGKGILAFDYDRDGDLDLFAVDTAGPPRLYRNDGGPRGDWLRVRTRGRRSNRDGYGARITVIAAPGAAPQVREVGVGSHYLGQSELPALFGLGQGSAAVPLVRVDWPASGASQELRDVPRNTTLLAEEPES